MSKIIKIESENHKDVIIAADKILFVVERKGGSTIIFGNELYLNTTATIEDVQKALEKCFEEGDTDDR